MDERLIRTEAILGAQNMEKLKNARVLLFGIGGVGGYAAEALARSGIGTLGLVDHDCVSLSNLNRQIIATEETIGQQKTDAMRARILSVQPSCHVHTYPVFYPSDTMQIPFSDYDYVIDAIDTVTSKIAIIEACKALQIPVLSSMGTGNKLDPTKLTVSDIHKTTTCPLARVMRKELKKRNIRQVKVVYSTEEPFSATVATEQAGRHAPGSLIMVPATAGLIIASEVIRHFADL